MNSRRTRRRQQSDTRHHPTHSVAGRDSKYRCNSVHSLPVSTTSYSRYVVNTSSLDQCANNGTVLNRHMRKFTFQSLRIHNQLVSARSPFHYKKSVDPCRIFYDVYEYRHKQTWSMMIYDFLSQICK